VLAILLLAAMLMFDRQFSAGDVARAVQCGAFARLAAWSVMTIVALNVISTLLECGFASCPDNPSVYQLLGHT
jgi:hypothetical protein